MRNFEIDGHRNDGIRIVKFLTECNIENYDASDDFSFNLTQIERPNFGLAVRIAMAEISTHEFKEQNLKRTVFHEDQKFD